MQSLMGSQTYGFIEVQTERLPRPCEFKFVSETLHNKNIALLAKQGQKIPPGRLDANYNVSFAFAECLLSSNFSLLLLL
jgi:hypothetical protein